jgi:hypothetical protein
LLLLLPPLLLRLLYAAVAVACVACDMPRCGCPAWSPRQSFVPIMVIMMIIVLFIFMPVILFKVITLMMLPLLPAVNCFYCCICCIMRATCLS